MAQYIDRYSQFKNSNSGVKTIPGITIPISSEDKKMIYKEGVTRLDILSNMYYNNPYSGWLIMLANPEFGGLEFNIPNMSMLRIPFPFESAMSRYNGEIKKHKMLYGE